MSPQPLQPASNPQPIPPSQPTFDQRALQAAENFAAELLVRIPEVSSVIVVPVWFDDTAVLPCGLHKGRDGAVVGAAAQLRATKQLLTVFESQLRQLSQIVEFYDRRAGDIAESIRTQAQQPEATHGTATETAASHRGTD